MSTIFSLSMEMSRLTRDGTAEPVSRDQILRHERGQGNIDFPCSDDHVQDWQPYPVDLYPVIYAVANPVRCLLDRKTWQKHGKNDKILKKERKRKNKCLFFKHKCWVGVRRLMDHLNVLTFFPPDWGMLRRSRCTFIVAIT